MPACDFITNTFVFKREKPECACFEICQIHFKRCERNTEIEFSAAQKIGACLGEQAAAGVDEIPEIVLIASVIDIDIENKQVAYPRNTAISDPVFNGIDFFKRPRKILPCPFVPEKPKKILERESFVPGIFVENFPVFVAGFSGIPQF